MIAAKAVCFELAALPAFHRRQQQTIANARQMGRALEKRGYRLVSGGTDTHLVLIDLRPRGIGGDTAEKALADAGLFANRNPVPFDDAPPGRPSGLRLGAPAITARGMGPEEVEQIVEWIDRLLRRPQDAALRRSVRGEVSALCQRFALPS